jgi:hypothetical protein
MSERGNGAREALMEILDDSLVKMLAAFDTERGVDAILLKLAAKGFKIAPLEEQ